MMRAVVLVLLVLGTSAPLAGAADWLQAGFDAARGGVQPDRGPLFPDVALDLELPGARTNVTGVLIGDAFYVTTRAYPGSGVQPGATKPGLNTSALWRIDLATGETRALTEFDNSTFVEGLASDGRRLFLVVDLVAKAYDLEGDELWSVPLIDPAERPVRYLGSGCAPSAVDQGLIVVGCWSSEGSRLTVAVAIAAETGEELWRWPSGGSDATGALPGMDPGTATATYLNEVAISDELVLLVTEEMQTRLRPECGTATPAGDLPVRAARGLVYVVWALERDTGEVRWAFVDWQRSSVGAANDAYDTALGLGRIPDIAVAATPEAVLVLGDQLTALDRANGCTLYTVNPRQATEGQLDEAYPRALVARPDFYVTSAFRHVVAFDAVSHEQAWASPMTRSVLQLVSAGPVLYGYLSSLGVVAIDATTGDVLWEIPIPPSISVYHDGLAMAPGNGTLVVTTNDGRVRVLGRTAASIQPVVSITDLAPALGEEVRVDLGGSRPGARADDLEYRVAWGDGYVSGWRQTPIFTHEFETPGEHVLVASLRNSADQTSSERITVMVGEDNGDTMALLATAFTGRSGLIVWPLVVLVAVAGVVAAGYARQARHERTRNTATTGPAPSQDATKVYREALVHAIAEDGTITDRDAAMLASLRAQLGITERDHALLEHAILTGGSPNKGLLLEPGQSVLGKYEVRQLLGEGGHGLTYHARDTVLDRDVVVKVLRTGTLSADDLLDEARAMGRVRHANVVTVHDVDRVGDQVFLVMEHMAGGGLDDALDDGPLADPRFHALARDLLGALAAVHRAGLVHRDVKPANILFDDDGSAKLADFGIVHTPGLEATMAAFQTIEQAIGTIPYMSPEQARGRPADGRSDLYSAALVLYEAYTGQRYFVQAEDEFVAELQMRVARGDAPELDAIDDEALRAWLARALAPDPADRFPSADEMARALHEVLDR